MSKTTRKYNKSNKSHGGAGLQFDKLLKACSNSKKASATKTAGALGRFGSASFTSTRNATFDMDSAGEDDTSRPLALLKRPRMDNDRSLGQISNDRLHYSSLSMYGQNSGNALLPQNIQNTAPPIPVFKPKKFFKSRNPVEPGQEKPADSYIHTPLPIRPEVQPFKPPIPPITIPIPKPAYHQQNDPPSGKRRPGRPKRSRKVSHEQDSTFVSPTNTTDRSNIPITSPSIKLRIFKDKTTSEFVSVSDDYAEIITTLAQDVENKRAPDHSPKKRGRPKANKGAEVTTARKPKKEKKVREVSVPSPKKSVRLTRNSRRQRNSDSLGESSMPVLTAAIEEPEHSSNASLDLFSSSPPNITSREVPEKALQLVEQLEADSEFREMSAALSSMEEGGESTAQDNHLMNSYNEQFQVPSQPTYAPVPVHNDYSQKPVNQFEESHASDEPRDLCSILEDEWGDSYDEESPKKPGSSPCKVTRFDMPDYMGRNPQQSHSRRDSARSEEKMPEPEYQAHELFSPSPPLPLQLPVIEPFNAPYAVRNLLSEFTDKQEIERASTPESPTDLSMPGTIDMPPLAQPQLAAPEKAKSAFTGVKKGSIFKSRNNASSTTTLGQTASPKKRLALYKHKFDGQETAEKPSAQATDAMHSPNSGFDDYDDSEGPIELRRVARTEKDRDGNDVTGDGARVYCKPENKKLFTVIRNVKAIHALQEAGEVHEFDGDIWYILSDLKDSNPISNRCLSAITLAMRCMEPSFRMHLRAHGTVAEFCKELHDAPTNPVLALLAATVLFVLSQDRLNMDLDTESLQLILALAKTEEKTHLVDENQELGKHRQRVIDLVTEMKNRGHAKLIKIEKITASELALETLLYLTSKRAGEWVKLELRTLGGLDYIVSEVEKSLFALKTNVHANGWTESALERVWKIDRCLKVLQQVSFNHEENQKYLLGCPTPSAAIESGESQSNYQCSPDVFVQLFQFLSYTLGTGYLDTETSTVLREILFSVLRVLVNLTHDYRGIILGSELLAAKQDFLPLTLHSIFTLSTELPDGKGFDLLMHSLCMLLNLVEHSRKIRAQVLTMNVRSFGSSANCSTEQDEQSTLDAFIQMFFAKEEDAKNEEASTDDILTNSTDSKKEPKDSQGSSQEVAKNSQESNKDSDSLQDIIDKLIQTAGKHMESSMIAAHLSLLIAYLVMDDPVATQYVRNAMPQGRFLPLMTQLKKLFNFMSITTTASGSTRGLKATSIALKFYAQCDPESNEDLKKVIPD